MAETSILILMALILGVGIGAKVLADKFRIPSILLLLISGVILGPSGFGLVTQETFGSTLFAIVGFAVAIIVFEGAFHLRIDDIRKAGDSTTRLVTIGAAIAFVGTGVLVHYALGASWEISFLIASLLVATGPTVITPILEVVSVREEVGTLMETEGIVNDVTAAVLAVVIFEVLVITNQNPQDLLGAFLGRLGTGVFIGIIGAGVVYYIVRQLMSSSNASQNSRLIVLGAAILIFAIANEIQSEAGVAAVATAGLILGNVDIPYKESIADFKGDITPIVLSIVFIILAALVDVQTITELGIPGIAVVLAVMFVIRPILVFVSTYNSGFSTREKLFVSLVAPRGIIPASVATLFAVRLTDTGAAETLVSTVFLVVFVTVALQGGLARQIANKLDVIPMRVIIIGGGTAGLELADRLKSREEDIVIIEKDKDRVEELRAEEKNVIHGDGTRIEILQKAGIENTDTLAAVTQDDDTNLLATKLADTEFEVDNVLARVNSPQNVESFEKLGVRTVSSPTATAAAIDDLIERPAMSDWMDDLRDEGDVQDTVLYNEEYDGATIEEFDQSLPDNVIVTLVTRNEKSQVPEPDFKLRTGDRITFIGNRESVRGAVALCEGDFGADNGKIKDKDDS